MSDANRKAEGYNPLCGDHVTVYLHLEDGVIRDIELSRLGLRDFQGFGVDDDGGAERQVRSRGP